MKNVKIKAMKSYFRKEMSMYMTQEGFLGVMELKDSNRDVCGFYMIRCNLTE